MKRCKINIGWQREISDFGEEYRYKMSDGIGDYWYQRLVVILPAEL